MCVKDGLGLSFFLSKNKGIIQRGFAVLERWVDASALTKEVVTDLKASSKLLRESISGMFRFFQSAFPGEDAPRKEEDRNLWNAIDNAGVKVVDNWNIDRGITWYAST